MITIIMAAGDNTRWKAYREPHHPMYKQLIDIKGETIIGRIVRQLDQMHIPHLVAMSDMKLVREAEVPTFLISSGFKTLAWSILATHKVWSLPLTILLGDVVFDQQDLNLIYTPTDQDVSFFGSDFEIYAVVFKTSPYELLFNSSGHIEGKLRDVRYYLNSIDSKLLPEDEVSSRFLDPRFFFVNGWTRDIDHKFSLSKLLSDPRFKAEDRC